MSLPFLAIPIAVLPASVFSKVTTSLWSPIVIVTWDLSRLQTVTGIG
jgi:hypothetical protein